RHARRALKDRERCFRAVPHPLRFVAVHRGCARGKRREIESNHRQAIRLRAVPEDRDGELGARQVGLDQDGLGVAVEQAPGEIAGTRASRLWPWSPSAMLKTISGLARTTFCGKN